MILGSLVGQEAKKKIREALSLSKGNNAHLL